MRIARSGVITITTVIANVPKIINDADEYPNGRLCFPHTSSPGSHGRYFRVDPRRAVGPAQQSVSLVVPHDPTCLRIPAQRSTQLHRHIGKDTTCCGDMPFLDVSHWSASRGDGPQ